MLIAVVAFIGSFVLVKYKLEEAKLEEEKQAEKTGQPNGTGDHTDGIRSRNPHLQQEGLSFLGKGQPLSELLTRTHHIAIITAGVGFVFIIAGIVCYSWTQQARSAAIFSSACIGICILATIVTLTPLSRAKKT